MSAEFSIYHRVLGIPEHISSPNPYELLGVSWGEDDAELIRSAADRRSQQLEPLLPGAQGALARRILAEIWAARDCLLDREAKANYHRQLGLDIASPAGEQLDPPRTMQPPDPVEAKASLAAGQPAAINVFGCSPDVNKSGSVLTSPPLPHANPPTRDIVRIGSEESPTERKPAALRPVDDESGCQHVPIAPKMALESILEELEQAMQQCRQLYLSSIPPSQKHLRPVSRQFAETQDRLHRGLLAKIYATIAMADGRLAWGELCCAEVLLKHLEVKFCPDDLNGTTRKLIREALRLDWRLLFQPFREIQELRYRSAELQTVIARVANLIAKADGHVTPDETAALQQIQNEFWSPRPPVVPEELQIVLDPVDAPIPNETSGELLDSQPGPRPKNPERRKKPEIAKLREDRLQQLEALVGLRQVKLDICELADWALFQSRRRQARLPDETLNLQFVFVGPSGTGKTLVARLVSELLFANGGLKQGQLVEVSGYDLVSYDVCEAANKMKASLTQAIGGMLVINDAGALLLADNLSASKALSVLRKNLTRLSGRLAVVLAADHSDRLLPLLDSYADLRQSFQRCWHFTDYSTSELGQMFQSFCERSQYRLTRLALIKVLLGFHWCVSQQRNRFANGHGVLRVFEQAVHRLAHRISGVSPLTKELLTTFHDGDITIEGVPARALADLADSQRLFAVTCPNPKCPRPVHLVGKDLLGILVECKYCHHRFLCAWGEPVE